MRDISSERRQTGADLWDMMGEEDKLAWTEWDLVNEPTEWKRRYIEAKMRVWDTMEHPESSTLGFVITMVILFCIILSIAGFIVNGTPSIVRGGAEATWAKVLDGIEYSTVAIFTVELGARFWACKGRGRFFLGPMNVLDLLAILPFYIELGLQGQGNNATAVLRILRLARVFRLFKVSRYSTGIIVFTRALIKSSNALVALLLYLMMAMILFSALMFLAEAGEYDPVVGKYIIDGKISDFQSLPLTFYWAITTMTTVGYGDLEVTTDLGRFIANLTMVCGLLVMSLPMTVIGANFADIMQELVEDQELENFEDDDYEDEGFSNMGDAHENWGGTQSRPQTVDRRTVDGDDDGIELSDLPESSDEVSGNESEEETPGDASPAPPPGGALGAVAVGGPRQKSVRKKSTFNVDDEMDETNENEIQGFRGGSGSQPAPRQMDPALAGSFRGLVDRVVVANNEARAQGLDNDPDSKNNALAQLNLEVKAFSLADKISQASQTLTALIAEHQAVVNKLQEKRKMSKRLRAYVNKVNRRLDRDGSVFDAVGRGVEVGVSVNKIKRRQTMGMPMISRHDRVGSFKDKKASAKDGAVQGAVRNAPMPMGRRVSEKQSGGHRSSQLGLGGGDSPEDPSHKEGV